MTAHSTEDVTPRSVHHERWNEHVVPPQRRGKPVPMHLRARSVWMRVTSTPDALSGCSLFALRRGGSKGTKTTTTPARSAVKPRNHPTGDGRIAVVLQRDPAWPTGVDGRPRNRDEQERSL